jgi:DNA-binding response OmpR family regulator
VRVLVVEDNRDILENIADYLALKGHQVDKALDGISGLHLATLHPYDLIVLDIMLPGMDGLQLCKRLRQDTRRNIPIIMVTARDQLEDRLIGFETGADAYLVKPFALAELVARIDAVTYRYGVKPRNCMEVGDLSYDLDTLEVTRAGKPLKLDPIGHKILVALMAKSPWVVRRAALEKAIWGEARPGSDSLRSHVHNLRQVIDKPFGKPLLHTVRGVGFCLVAPSDQDTRTRKHG